MKRLLIASVLAAIATGCSIDANVGELYEAPVTSVVIPNGEIGEFVSGSMQYQDTLGGGAQRYKVQVTVGNPVHEIYGETTPSGYKVYSTVQGAIATDL